MIGVTGSHDNSRLNLFRKIVFLLNFKINLYFSRNFFYNLLPFATPKGPVSHFYDSGSGISLEPLWALQIHPYKLGFRAMPATAPNQPAA
jgi:hypothetical protein